MPNLSLSRNKIIPVWRRAIQLIEKSYKDFIITVRNQNKRQSTFGEKWCTKIISRN